MTKTEDYKIWVEHGKSATRRFDDSTSQFRQEKRNTWSQITVLSAAILGLSVTFFSLDVSQIASATLVVAWIVFVITILVGVYLLVKENNEFAVNNFKTYLYAQDDVDRETDYLAGKIDRAEYDKLFMALSYLRFPTEISWNDKAKILFEENQDKLHSWKFLKNPNEYYFKPKGNLELLCARFANEKYFLYYFVVAIITLTLGVILAKIT